MASTVTSPRRLPSDPPEPDISHLTEDEQQIILSVLKRSKAEEQKDEKIISNLEQDVKRIEANIKRMQKTVTDSVGLLGNASDPDTCRICNVVKFAGGAGYRCHYCQLKSCSRCGGKLTFKTKIIWACNLCRKKQELALKTGTWYNGPKGSGFQRRHSLLRQTSFTSDNETSGHRRSRDMLPSNAAKRSSSAHALMETDRLDENMNQYRFRTRILSGDTSDKRGNGDVGQAVRLRGEMESTTLATPNRNISSAGNKQFKNVSKSGSSGSQFLTMQRDDLAPLAAASPTNRTPSQSSSLSSSSRTLTTGGDSLDNRAWKAASSPPLDSNRGPVTGVRVSPYLDKMQTGSDSTLRDQTSSLSSRRSDSSLRSHERAQAQDLPAFASEESSHTQKEHSFSSGLKIQTKNQNSRQEELIFCQDGNYHSISTSRPPQRPDPAPRRCIPEPAARTSKAVSASNSRDPHAEAHIPASRNNSGSSSGRERSLPAEYDFNEKSIDSSTRMQAQKSDKFDPHSFESVGDKKSHQALYRQHRPSDRGEQKREVMVDSRERNSSQESNSTNISNKLTVPGMPGYSADGDHTKSARSRREMTMLHADSLSSDPSDCVRPRPPKPHKARKVKSNGSGGKNQNNSPSRRNSRQEASSSDEEIRSTTSCGDDLESESVISEQVAVPRNDNVCDVTRKETADKIKAIRNFLAHPVEWQVTSDHRHIIGHMILSKTLNADGQPHQDSGVILGLKVTGGRGVPGENRIAAFITAVKRGSIADTVGHLLSGDEVLEWNGRSLQGATSDEVCEVLLESKQEPEVELIIKRPFHPDALPPALQYLRDQATTRYADSPPRVTVTSADSPGMTRRLMSIAHVTGKIQLKLWYNAQEQDLTITVLGASELPLIEGNQPPQAFCKILLLPDSSEASLRTTKPVGRTREPEWQQNFNYGPISKAEFQGRSLDVSVWSKKKNNPDEFLGEISIELSTAKLNNEALWYRLRNHKNSNSRFPKYKQRSAGSQGTGSVGSKSRTSRQEMSDTGSEISDGNILEDESHYRSRHGSPDALGRHGQHHQPPPRPRHHSANQLSREGPGIHGGPSPVPRRRQLPQVPQVPQMHQGSVGPHRSVPVSDRVPSHILDQHGTGGERPYYRGAMNGRYPIEQRDRSYSDSRVAASDDEMFMSDGSEMSEFSMRSTQSERPKSSNNFRRFMNRMESRGPAGRRQALPHLGIAASPLSYPPGDSGEPGTMSDSGMSNSHTDHRSNRQMGAYGRLHDHHERRYHKLNKQASKDSTDGSICSISSDSSNA